MRNYILESSEKFNAYRNDLPPSMQPTGFHDTEKYRQTCINLTGHDNMPAVIYKGILIEPGRLGMRELII